MLGWESIECVLQDESSHAGSINTPRNGLSVEVEQAREFRPAFLVSVGSYSGLTRSNNVTRDFFQ
jgi:hypothetical protein